MEKGCGDFATVHCTVVQHDVTPIVNRKLRITQFIEDTTC